MIQVEMDARLAGQGFRDVLHAAALATLQHQLQADADLALVLTGDARLRALNRDFLGINAPTDVLSFPSGEIDPETGRSYLGDVVLSLARARQQAKRAGHPVQVELQLLVIHGVLHLLGYDHAAGEEKQRMASIQAQVLERLGLDPRIGGLG